MLDIQEEPEPVYESVTQPRKNAYLNIRCNYRIDNCDSAIERKLGNLSGRELSVGVSKFHCRSVLNAIRCESSRTNAIISGLLNSIIDR